MIIGNIDVIIFMNLKEKIKDLLEEEVDLMSAKNVVDLVVKIHQAIDMKGDEINIQKNNHLLVDHLIAVYILQKRKKLLIIIFNHLYVHMIKDLGSILLQKK